MADMDKNAEYWSNDALETLDYLRKQGAKTRNPEVAALVAHNLKILCCTDTLMEDTTASAAAGDWEARGSYGGSSYEDGMGTSGARGGRRGTHYVRGHYSHAGGYSGTPGTLSRMMEAADPREREILERLLRKVDD